MISAKMQDELNQRINDEIYSWYLYLAMVAYFNDTDLLGFASWMKVQAEEEMKHAMKNYAYLLERGGSVSLKAIAQPTAKWDSALAAIQAAYDHEQKISSIYNKFMDAAIAERDHASVAHIQWFVNEQVEEEASTLEIVRKLKLIKESVGGIFALDHQLGHRGK